jgi:hypothetical protein
MTIPHPHVWRRMTSEQDYANPNSPHWGGYTGREKEICRICGITRKCQSWQTWRYELDDAERRVKYLASVEPKRDSELGAEHFGAEGK